MTTITGRGRSIGRAASTAPLVTSIVARPRSTAIARVVSRLGLAGTLVVLAGPAVASGVELFGAGWPTSTVTYAIEAGVGVTRQAVEDVRDAAEDWNVALALGDVRDGQTVRVVPARGARAGVLVRLDVAPGAITARVSYRTVTATSCELTGARIEIRGALLGQPTPQARRRNVARHAIGHVLGLGHSDDPTSIMRAGGDTERGFGATDVPVGRCEALVLPMLHPPIECPLPPMAVCY